jgi:hypothetical protein
VVLSKEAARELEMIVTNLLRKSPGEEDILQSSGGRDFVAKRITARTYVKVCEQLGI